MDLQITPQKVMGFCAGSGIIGAGCGHEILCRQTRVLRRHRDDGRDAFAWRAGKELQRRRGP
jgi:hypothetical protein